MKRSLVVLLVGIPLAIAGCGGSGATPRTAAGVRSDYVQFSKLAFAGNGAAACSRYISPAVVAELNAVGGGCAKLLDWAVAQKDLNPSAVTNGWTASVNGSNATYQTATASGTAVYADGHWMFAENSSTSPTSTPPKSEDAAAKELAHTAQVAIETLATDNNGSYASANGNTSALAAYEATIQTTAGSGNAYLSGVVSTANSYTVTTTAISGDRFSINRLANGSLTRTCTPSSTGGCTDGSW
jgi:hypothetical protein